MKAGIIIFAGFFSIFTLGAEEWKTGLNFGLDGIQMSFSVLFLEKAEISLEAGAAWERNADFRMDDAIFAANFRYILPFLNKTEPYVKSGIKALFINTGYKTMWIPGFDVGLGLGLPIGEHNRLFLEGGWQYASRETISREKINNYEVINTEIWKSPPFFRNNRLANEFVGKK